MSLYQLRQFAGNVVSPLVHEKYCKVLVVQGFLRVFGNLFFSLLPLSPRSLSSAGGRRGGVGREGRHVPMVVVTGGPMDQLRRDRWGDYLDAGRGLLSRG